jgi:hypothetical protein
MDACASQYCHSVTSARVDLCIDNNGTWSDAFQFGKPGDLTWTLENKFEMEVQRSEYDEVPLLFMDVTGGKIIIDDPVQRVIHFNVTAPEIRSQLRPGQYVYDLVMVAANGVRTPLMHGTVTVVQGVTFT